MPEGVFNPVAFQKWLIKNFDEQGNPRQPNPSLEGWFKYTCVDCKTEFSTQFKLDESRARCKKCFRPREDFHDNRRGQTHS